MVLVKKHKRKRKNGVSVVRQHQRIKDKTRSSPEMNYAFRNFTNDYDSNNFVKSSSDTL